MQLSMECLPVCEGAPGNIQQGFFSRLLAQQGSETLSSISTTRLPLGWGGAESLRWHLGDLGGSALRNLELRSLLSHWPCALELGLLPA